MTKHTLQMPDELYARLTTLATEAGQSADELILAALKEHLEDLEDIRIGEEVLAARASGDNETIPFAEVRRRLGLDD